MAEGVQHHSRRLDELSILQCVPGLSLRPRIVHRERTTLSLFLAKSSSLNERGVDRLNEFTGEDLETDMVKDVSSLALVLTSTFPHGRVH
jgi:hypothetical protein